MTNWDRWQAYNSGLSSPQNYIDWSWLYLVGAALQRRVWVGPEHQPVFANKYVILVGEPGIGKGLPIRAVSDFLSHWKKKDGPKLDPITLSPVDQERLKILNECDFDEDVQEKAKIEPQGKAKAADLMEPLLFPMAADATTYEALVLAVADAYTKMNYVKTREDGTKKLEVTGHSSVNFCLQELASLMRKRTEDIVNYMLGLYDCPTDYMYQTISRGKDRVRRGCLNVLAGTTPSFMQSTFDDKLADEGFNSRTFYIYAKKNRKNQFFMPLLAEEQKQHKIDLLNHIRALAGLYGNVTVDAETYAYLAEWWDDQEKNKHKRPNTSIKLKPYYSRKNIHVMKLAMAKHFGESTEMHIPLETFKWAIEFLAAEEKNMHLAIVLEAQTPVAKASQKILEHLTTGRKTMVEVLVATHHVAKKSEVMEAIEFLQETSQIEQDDIPIEGTDRFKCYFQLFGEKEKALKAKELAKT